MTDYWTGALCGALAAGCIVTWQVRAWWHNCCDHKLGSAMARTLTHLRITADQYQVAFAQAQQELRQEDWTAAQEFGQRVTGWLGGER